MKRKILSHHAAACALCLLISAGGCSTALITGPVIVSKGDLTITLTRLTRGPNQYNTAGGFWEPKRGREFLWGTFVIVNRGKSERIVTLDRIILHAGSKQVKPFIIDMDAAVTMKANDQPRLASGETISRKIIYVIPESAVPEKVAYEKDLIPIPALR